MKEGLSTESANTAASAIGSLEAKIPAPVVAGVLGGGMKFYATTAQIPIDASPILAELGIRVAQLSALVALVAFATLWIARTTINPFDPSRTTRLVTGGVYRLSRNPLYLSLLLLLVAYAIRLGTWTEWVGPTLFAAYITRFQIIPEERILAQKFGEEFAAYRQRTRRWI